MKYNMLKNDHLTSHSNDIRTLFVISEIVANCKGMLKKLLQLDNYIQ